MNQAQLAREIEEAVRHLPAEEVVRVSHRLGEDSTGDPAVFLRVVLTDAASKPATLGEITGKIAGEIYDRLRFHENWGLIPYFSFRSKSEQDLRNDPEWL